jgi:FkbM family methyltransferase
MTLLAKHLAKTLLPQHIWTKLRIERINWSVRHYKSHVVRHTYGDLPLNIWLADPLAQGWYDHDWSELPEIELLKHYRLHNGARVFDLGAHQCVVALILAKIVGSRGQVVALEANPHNAMIARLNRALNDAPQLEIVEAAAAEKSGTLYFNHGLDGCVDDGTGQWGRREVRSLTVDNLTDTYGVPDLLFIDVEGFEAKVLEGAPQTLRHRPDCLVEVHVGCGLETYGYSADAVLSFFSPDQYRVFIAPQSESNFRELGSDARLPKERFFLAAVDRRPGVAE